MIITILTDNKKSWFVPFGSRLKTELEKLDHKVHYVFDKNDIIEGDICFLLSCSRIVDIKYLKRNYNNIVIHASDLPEGKGFAPLQWQILQGESEIVLTLFEVIEKVDAGPYYLKNKINFDGTELYEQLRHKLGEKIVEMCTFFVEHKFELKPIAQTGGENFYRRRTNSDDEINVDKTIAEQFNHFRIADNENYPLYFYYKNKKYFLKIYTNEE